MRKRFLPAPLLSLALFGLWLLLNHSTSVGHITLGALLGWAIPLLTRGLRPLPVRVRRPGTILRLATSCSRPSGSLLSKPGSMTETPMTVS